MHHCLLLVQRVSLCCKRNVGTSNNGFWRISTSRILADRHPCTLLQPFRGSSGFEPIAQEVVSSEDSQPSSLLSSTKEADDVNISDSCVKRLQKVVGPNDFLRVMVDGGGCSGFEYKFSLDNEIKDDDVVYSKAGVRVVIDLLSLDYLKGATVDYHEELIKSSFRVINNPKAQHGCSCGASFSVKVS